MQCLVIIKWETARCVQPVIYRHDADVNTDIDLDTGPDVHVT